MKVLAFKRMKEVCRKPKQFVRFEGTATLNKVSEMIDCDRKTIPRYAKLICMAGIADFVESYRRLYGKVGDYTVPLNSYQAWVLMQFIRVIKQLPRRKDRLACAKNFVKNHKHLFTVDRYLSEIPMFADYQPEESSTVEVEVLPMSA